MLQAGNADISCYSFKENYKRLRKDEDVLKERIFAITIHEVNKFFKK